MLEEMFKLSHSVTQSLKANLQRCANRLGYSIQKISMVKNEYMPYPPYNYHTYCPWYDDWFKAIYSKIKEYTLVSEDRAYLLYMFSRLALNYSGDFAECGVYKGGTGLLLSNVIAERPEKKLYLFDSFKGMPSHADPATDYHGPGGLGDASYDKVKSLFTGREQVLIIEGFLPETLEPIKERNFAFVHLDVDIYRSTKDCLEFFYPRLIRGGILVSDDYGIPRYKLAARKACDEFFADKPEKPVALRTGQCFFIKL